MTHPVLLLTGMTPDPRTFERLLPSLSTASIVPWIEPLRNETVDCYASRLAATIEVSTPPIVCGVSFGGIIARELAWRLNANTCVLISSVRSPSELPPWLRALRPFVGPRSDSLLNLIGHMAVAIPKGVRTDASARLTKLSGRGGAWHRWASTAVLRWHPSAESEHVRVVQIHGSRDTTFPVQFVSADLVIEGGSHMIAFTHAKEIGAVISQLAAPVP